MPYPEHVTEYEIEKIKYELFNQLPFYEGLLYNKQTGSIRSAIYLNKKIVNTAARKTFIIEKNFLNKY